MHLKSFSQIGPGAGEDLPREQHAHRLAADLPGAHHPLADREEVGELEVVPAQAEHVVGLITAEQHADQPQPVRFRLGGIGLAGVDALLHRARLGESVRPRVAPLDAGVDPRLGDRGADLGELHALRDRAHLVAAPRMQHVHGG